MSDSPILPPDNEPEPFRSKIPEDAMTPTDGSPPTFAYDDIEEMMSASSRPIAAAGEVASSEPDSQPELAAESDPAARVGPETRRWRVAHALTRWLLPPVLAAGAMGMHFWINVPEEIQHSSKDQGAAKSKEEAKRPKPRDRFHARDQHQLDREWRRWGKQPFDEEGVRGPWARKFQTTISKAVVVARREAFAKAPEEPRVIVTATECRTVRCRFILRSPFEHELQVLDASLRRIVDHNGSIWRTYDTAAIAPPPDAPEGHHHLEVIVSFASDQVDSRGFEVGPETPGVPPRADAVLPADPGAPHGLGFGRVSDPDPDPDPGDDALGQPDEPEERGGAEDSD